MVSLLYAGLLGLLYCALTFYTIKGRFHYRISLGDGGNEDMQRRIRTHGNFAEYVPFTLVLLLLLELQGINDLWIHVMGISLLVARIIYSLKLTKIMDLPFGRQIGMIGTLSLLLIMSVLAILSAVIPDFF